MMAPRLGARRVAVVYVAARSVPRAPRSPNVDRATAAAPPSESAAAPPTPPRRLRRRANALTRARAQAGAPHAATPARTAATGAARAGGAERAPSGGARGWCGAVRGARRRRPSHPPRDLWGPAGGGGGGGGSRRAPPAGRRRRWRRRQRRRWRWRAATGADAAAADATPAVLLEGVPAALADGDVAATAAAHADAGGNGSTWGTTALLLTTAAAVPFERVVFAEAFAADRHCYDGGVFSFVWGAAEDGEYWRLSRWTTVVTPDGGGPPAHAQRSVPYKRASLAFSTRQWVHTDTLVAALRALPGVALTVAERLTPSSFAAQAATFAAADVVVAPHGAAVVNALFMPPDGAVVEVWRCCWDAALAGGAGGGGGGPHPPRMDGRLCAAPRAGPHVPAVHGDAVVGGGGGGGGGAWHPATLTAAERRAVAWGGDVCRWRSRRWTPRAFVVPDGRVVAAVQAAVAGVRRRRARR
ncbi:hypothetical protein BU14_0112s0023 [Porphyra umbilicalis]|uniref:Glycosyltransferase 61 catalytic domain-containing protein n=1 Tax=Porphyra umbilicalis TaxID=2786 RepID=A0A1X6PBV5_PORUM|nr:hypothetical protein BU14_0112s0023 [Porphyra umbilicalis]|eukprot:OSX78324.1 hypothetical protein BU14_0112s0023 [Porphyra umbilicalis]